MSRPNDPEARRDIRGRIERLAPDAARRSGYCLAGRADRYWPLPSTMPAHAKHTPTRTVELT